jgi:hypothetical protein
MLPSELKHELLQEKPNGPMVCVMWERNSNGVLEFDPIRTPIVEAI